MEKLITGEEAKKIVSGSDERKQELVKQMNASITAQAQRGLCWAHFPTSASADEKEWLKEELVLAGFKVNENHPNVSW